MNAPAPQLRARLPRIAQEAVERARLTVVPRTRRRTRAPRIPFVALISTILLAGVVGLLLFNTSMQQASFRATALEQQASDLAAQQEAMEMELAQQRDPQHIAEQAQAMGMGIPSTPSGVIDLADGTIEGDPVPVTAEDTVPLVRPGPTRPAEFDPAPVTVQADVGGDGGDRNGDRNGDRDGDRDGRRDGRRDGDRGARGSR